ncbi:MAG: DUF2214 family protein [Burkholderiaceae bacterium]|jgi:putative membrane protein|nr:DUF2214 family protein [Burkholderiaceae bacterium]
MLEEALLAFVHISAILTMFVFLTSAAVLCRGDWLNAAALRRLARVNTLYLACLAITLLTGLARTWWGVKGLEWYWGNYLLHIKLLMLAAMVGLAVGPARSIARWRAALEAGGTLPAADQVRRARLHLMVAAHIGTLIPLPAVFMARGFG